MANETEKAFHKEVTRRRPDRYKKAFFGFIGESLCKNPRIRQWSEVGSTGVVKFKGKVP